MDQPLLPKAVRRSGRCRFAQALAGVSTACRWPPRAWSNLY